MTNHLLITKESNNMVFDIAEYLNVTDKDVLESILTGEGVKTAISYHSKQASATRIENLVKVI